MHSVEATVEVELKLASPVFEALDEALFQAGDR
jgi:hypothetical protein